MEKHRAQRVAARKPRKNPVRSIFSWSLPCTAPTWRSTDRRTIRAGVTLRAGQKTVRQFLRDRFGIVTGAREYQHRPNWTPDRADLQEFLRALRDARAMRTN